MTLVTIRPSACIIVYAYSSHLMELFCQACLWASLLPFPFHAFLIEHISCFPGQIKQQTKTHQQKTHSWWSKLLKTVTWFQFYCLLHCIKKGDVDEIISPWFFMWQLTLQKKKNMSQSVGCYLHSQQCFMMLRTMNMGQMIRYYQIQSWEQQQCNEDDTLLYNMCISFQFRTCNVLCKMKKKKCVDNAIIC